MQVVLIFMDTESIMKYFIALTIIIMPLLLSKVVLAQENISPLQFHGSNRSFGQYSNRQGTNSQIPPSLWRNDLNMTLTIYDIPISSSFFITSEQSDSRQSINNFRIYINLKQLAINKAKTYARNKAKGLAKEKAPGFVRFLSNFTTFEAGKCRPHYSPLTVRGIRVSGVNFEFTPGIFYSAFSMGKIKKAIEPSETLKPTYKQDFMLGKIGVGEKQGSHLYFTYAHTKDDINSLLPVSETFSVYPQDNFVIGSEACLNLFEKKFRLEGEVAVSMLTRDIRSSKLVPEDSDIPSWVSDIVNTNISSSVDYAYMVKSSLNLKTTKLSGGVKMIGPGYRSLSAPNLRNDIMTYDGRIVQSFLKRRITLSAYCKHSKDNLINWKRTTTTTNAFSVSLGIRFRNYPYLQINYMPHFQKNDSDSLRIENAVHVFSMTTGYNYPVGKLIMSTTFNIFYQNTETIFNTMTSGSENQTYMLNETVSFEIPLTLAGGVSYSKSEYSGQKLDILMLTFSGTHRAFKKWRNTLGVRYSNQIEEQKKIGIFWNSKVKLWKSGDLDIRVEENIFRDKVHNANNYNEFIARAILLIKW